MKDEGSKLFYNHRFLIGVGWAKAGRDYMQDAFNIQFNKQARDRQLDFFGVFDGHGPNGENVAREAAMKLSNEVIRHYETDPSFSFPQAIELGCLLFDDVLRRSKHLKSPNGFVYGGTTGCAVWVMGDIMYSGNVGDSRFILSYEGEPHAVTVDHKPRNHMEKKRVVKAGGYISEDNRINGVLAVSRSFGDFQFKQNDALAAHEQLVTAVPDVRTVEIDDGCDFFVVATDGIWDMLTNKQVVDMVINGMGDENPLHKICEDIINCCRTPIDPETGMGSDNMSIIICTLISRDEEEEEEEYL